tara:strand:+ start:519 stop:1208 length:690 start_codon:yes stop_codon:yes gene_type:complete
MSNYDVNKISEELTGWNNGDYYGQWETDKVIETYFPEGYKGVCIEVGAANGVKGSNTLYFEERGWGVLCIEPNSEHRESLEKYRKLVRYFACGSQTGTFPLTIFRVGKNNITSSLTSLDPDKRLVEDHIDLISEKYELEVKVETLSNIIENEVEGTLFESIREIDFISIDTEGTELDVLKGLDFSQYSVTLLVVENNYNDKEIEDFMMSKGYRKDRRYKINDFYVKDEQ